MRKIAPFWAAILAVASLWAGAAQADGGKSTGDFVARPPSGPTDSRLIGKESATSASPSTQSPGSPSKMDAAPATNPPVAPQAVEEATPTPAAKAQSSAEPVVETQSLAGSSTPIWESRWFWALLALLLLLLAAAIEYFGRKRDERLAAEEPGDAVKA